MVILVLSIITSFFNIYVYQIKHDVLSYFAEVDQKVVNHCEKGALDFYTMIQTDNFDIIKKDNLRVNRWMENRLECEEKESTHLATHS